MGDYDKLKQKLEGRMEQIKGEWQEQKGEGVKGGFTKAKGKIKEEIAGLDKESNNTEEKEDYKS